MGAFGVSIPVWYNLESEYKRDYCYNYRFNSSVVQFRVVENILQPVRDKVFQFQCGTI